MLRALAILELVAQKSGGFTNAEISRRLKIATSTTSYILSRLERAGYLKRDSVHGRYEIGLKVVALAHGALREMGLRRAAEPILHRIAAETYHSAIIAVYERGTVMIVDKVEQLDLAKIDMDLGVRYPAHTTALGKAMLAHLPAQEVEAVFDGFLATSDAKTAGARKRQKMQELAQVKDQGYAISDGELFPGIWAVAAPIFDGAGKVRAALSATGGRSVREKKDIRLCIMRAAKEISDRLAYSESVKQAGRTIQ